MPDLDFRLITPFALFFFSLSKKAQFKISRVLLIILILFLQIFLNNAFLNEKRKNSFFENLDQILLTITFKLIICAKVISH